MSIDEQIDALLTRIGDDWMDLSEQLIVSRMAGAEERINDYRHTHLDIWPAMIEQLAVIAQAEQPDEERTKQELAYMQTLPDMNRALALDYLRYQATMGLAQAIVQQCAVQQIVGSCDELEKRASQKALQLAVQSFDGVGEAQAKLIARSFMQQAQQCVQEAANALGYAEASMGRANV